HAPSSDAKVCYQIVNDQFIVTISDNGPGFNAKEALTLREDGGQGLIGLKDRAESIAGNVDIMNSNGMGTRLTLTLPCQKGLYL
ncbi:MAG: ATP-binding protein, partial [Amylibacter sp.]